MKKTLVAILALSGMACAAETAITLDNAFIKSGELTLNSAVDAVLALPSDDKATLGAIQYDRLAHGCTNPSAAKGKDALNQTLTLTEMMSTGGNIYTTDGDKLILTSIQIVSRRTNDFRPTDATLTLSSGETATADYSALGDSGRGLITFTFAEGVDITGLTNLTFGITTYDISKDQGFGYTCYKAANGATLAGDSATYNGWHMATRLNVTKFTTPEPATATLSLLALAGLASRRRRH